MKCKVKRSQRSKRDPIKNCFLVPNEVFQLKLRASEIAIYCYLLFCEDRETYQCYPSYKTIGDAVGMTENTVRKYIAMLEEKQIITTAPTVISSLDGLPRNGALLYTIRPIQEVVACNRACQLQRLDAAVERQKVQKLLAEYAQGSDDGDST